jgi:hypothetical protein
MKSLGKLGGLLGILYCLVGFLLVFLGWNGAASYDRVSAQVPYVVSGGIGGLALVVLGTGLIVVQSHRADRAALEAAMLDLNDVLDRIAAGASEAAVAASGASQGASAPMSGTVSAGTASGGSSAPMSGRVVPDDEVLAGPSSFHRPACRLVEGQSGLAPMTRSAAVERGLEACRICLPAT